VWWVILLVLVAFAGITAVVVRSEPVFGVASPYMNAADAWALAAFQRQSRLNGGTSSDYFKPPKNAGLGTTVIAQIIAGTGMMLMFAGRYAYNKANPDKTATMSDLLTAIKDGQKDSKTVLENIVKAEGLTNAMEISRDIREWSLRVADRESQFLRQLDQCGENPECEEAVTGEYQDWYDNQVKAQGDDWWDRVAKEGQHVEYDRGYQFGEWFVPEEF
jgi:hypothetical protein